MGGGRGRISWDSRFFSIFVVLGGGGGGSFLGFEVKLL